jgi:hypothetical protein
MFTRISDIALLLALTACGGSDTSNGPAPLQRDTDLVASTAPPPKTVCAVDGSTELAPVCDRELVGDTLTLRHPSGGFRRLLIVTDGRGVVAADGAETANVQTVDANSIAVSIAGDRYRLPATVQR